VSRLVTKLGFGLEAGNGVRKVVMIMNNNERKPIKNFHDLEVYQNSYNACIDIMKKIVPKLPEIEKNDLKSQISQSCKAIPRLIAEGYGKRHQKRGFQKYLDDSLSESNEMIVSLCQCKDIYYKFVDVKLCNDLIDIYDKTSRQLYNLSTTWTNFKEERIRASKL
jgi:four helix bundle protein